MQIAGIDFAFVLFALTLMGVALFHKYTLQVALAGFLAVLIYKLSFTDFHLALHLQHEALTLLNLLGLLLGFAILASHFEHSGVPALLPRYLPDDWKGNFLLLLIVFILSAFLDNIAAAMIGGGIAHVVYQRKVHIGFLAAIVAASNAGGSGSVLGDTTTTMMWISGISPFDVDHAYVAAVPAFLVFASVASWQQQCFQPIMKDEIIGARLSIKRLSVCALILVGAVLANVLLDFPALGVWAGIALGAPLINTRWSEVKQALPGSLFLLSLVLCASMMPVEQLPPATWQSTFIMGVVSAVFDNIPLTKLALQQGGYDWGLLAYAVGFGGSMLWFGSSAGVAISNMYAETKSVGQWLRHGWHVAVAYVVGFAVAFALMGWQA